MSELFPNSPAGIRAAIESTPIDGYWEERVDLTAEFQPGVQTEESMALAALVQTIGSSPELFSADQIDTIKKKAQVDVSRSEDKDILDKIDHDELVLDYDPSIGVARSAGGVWPNESIHSRWDVPPEARRVTGKLA